MTSSKSTDSSQGYYDKIATGVTLNAVELISFLNQCEQDAKQSIEFREEFEDISLIMSFNFLDPEPPLHFILLEGEMFIERGDFDLSEELLTDFAKSKNIKISFSSVHRFTITCTFFSFLAYISGSLDPMEALFDERFKIEGDIRYAIILEKLISIFYGFLGL
ncbi:MAG: SCP2 sterol-binding domain-containing protein [Promethearchaeota archaeon]